MKPLANMVEVSSVGGDNFGMSLTLDDATLEKLGVDSDDWKVGDMFHLHVLAKITTISGHETVLGKKNMVVLSVTHMSGEDESTEERSFDKQAEAD